MNKGIIMSEDIHYTAEYETIEDMQNLLEANVNIDSLNEFGSTPLHSAIGHDKTEMALFLLNKGSNPTLQSNMGYTALHKAVLYSNLEVAEAILKKCPEVVNIESEVYGTALLQAIGEDNRSPYSMIKLLLAHGANKQDKSLEASIKARDIDELTKLFEDSGGN